VYSLGGRLALGGSHSRRARLAARSGLGLSAATSTSTVAEVPLLRLSKREAASQSLGVGDPLLGRGSRSRNDGELSRGGEGLESSVVLALGARFESLGAGRGDRLGRVVSRDGLVLDSLRLRSGDLGDPSPNS